jgi:UDP-N-acetylglucosamine 2-epimerase (non-hydrolysing)
VELGTPALVLRDETDRPEALDVGAALLVGRDAGRMLAAIETLGVERRHGAMKRAGNPFGDGNAARRILERLVADFSSTSRRRSVDAGAAVTTL